MDNSIPEGLCQCGCGQRTKINTQDRPARGLRRGQPSRFVKGHNARQYSLDAPPPPIQMCACGCGLPTSIAKQNDPKRGYVRGQRMKYRLGHKKPKITTPQGFWKHVDRRGPDECWPWLGYINDSGYGATRTKNNKLLRAHRISYRLAHGSIPKGVFICHHCDNPACVNPAHLFSGTPADNVRDMDKKGRRVNAPSLGEAHGMSRLTAGQVTEIRTLAASGITNAEIARRFSISDTHIWRIVSRRNWKHIK